MSDDKTTLIAESPLMEDIAKKKELRKRIIQILANVSEDHAGTIMAIETLIVEKQIEVLDKMINKLKQ